MESINCAEDFIKDVIVETITAAYEACCLNCDEADTHKCSTCKVNDMYARGMEDVGFPEVIDEYKKRFNKVMLKELEQAITWIA